MQESIPRYYDPEGNLTFQADSCKTLREAWHNNRLELTTLARGTYPGKELTENELEGIKNIGYWNIKKLQNWGLDWHTNEGIEICLLESGNLDFQINEQEYKLQPNDITITRPWIIHKIGAPNVDLSKLHWLIIDLKVRHPHQNWEWPDWIVLNKEDLDELTSYLRQNEQPVWKANSEFKNCFVQIGNIIKQSDQKPYDSKIKILVNQLLVLLLEIFKEENIILDQSLIESKRTVRLFLESLESKLDENWTVIKMADFCLLGVTRFTHYCKEISNCAPIEFLNRLRLRKAAKLLLENRELSVTDVAFTVGFSSSQYFNYAFKRHFNKSPSEYKKGFNSN